MKSPLLIVFIIFNLLTVSMVSAANLYDEQLSESQLIVSQINESSALANCIDESSCSDFCHVTSHMVGMITHLAPQISKQTSLPFSILTESFHSVTIDPLQHPPISLI